MTSGRRQLIEGADTVAVSAISCFEVAWLAQHGRISLPCLPVVWFENALSESGITLLPITPVITARAVQLQEHHSDPQDRLIIASALVHQAKLMSVDGKSSKYAELDDLLL